MKKKIIPHSRPTIRNSDFEAIEDVLKSGMIASGQVKELFEKEFARFVDQRFCNLTVSGTMAFYKILLALKVDQGDEILIPDYICSSIAFPILNLSAKVVLYDNEPFSWHGSITDIERKITSKTKVIVINHTFGKPFTRIKELDVFNCYVVEDCSHLIAPGGRVGDFKIGKNSLCAFFSFNATKLMAGGEGGAITTNNPDFFNYLLKVKIGDYVSDITASLLRSQLKVLPNLLANRQKIAFRYKKEIDRSKILKTIDQPAIYFRFPLMLKEKKELWQSEIVGFRRGVDHLVSNQLQYPACPNALDVLGRTISVPIYPSLNENEIDEIIAETNRFLHES